MRRTISHRLDRRICYRFRTSHSRLSCGVVATHVAQRCQRRRPSHCRRGVLNPGGRGRIRTFVARKERQIYSLLVLATHPPVRENMSTQSTCQKNANRAVFGAVCAKTQNGLVSKDTSPFMLTCRESLRLTPLPKKWWSWRRELNPRPSDYKSDALPAELRQHCSNRTRIAD